MINPPRATKAPDIKRKSILDWSTGTVTNYDSRRVVNDALKSSVNMVLEQNGVVRPRPSLVPYGPQPEGKILGEIFECKVVNGGAPTFYLIAMQVIEGKAYICYCRGEDVSWTRITTAEYDTSAAAHYVQIGEKVLIMNGVNHLSYLDLKTWEITTFAKVDDPTTKPTLTATGLSGTGFVIHYAVTASSVVGETLPSPAASVTVNKARTMWDAKTQNVKISWSAIPGAKAYNLYVGTETNGEGIPTMQLLQANIDPGVTNFTDDGTQTIEISCEAPKINSTAGPRATRGTVVNGRVWLVGDVDNPSYVWYGGNPGYEIDFSPSGHGGGRVAVATGTKEIPIAVMPFRRGTGDSTVVVLTQSSNGAGRRFQISNSTVTHDGEEFIVWAPTEDSGRDGTDSPDAVVVHNNSLFYPSRDGFKTTGTMPSLQNILSTRTISETIRDQVALLKSSEMDKAVGLVYEGRIYWALPVGSTENNRIWIYHPDQKGAWMTSWYLKVRWMTLYNDNGGDTHFLMYCDDDKIYELNRNIATADDGVAFRTDMTSGQIQFSGDGRDWSRLIQVMFTFLRPKGKIGITVEAMTEDGETRYTQTLSVTRKTAAEGWSKVTNKFPRLVGWSKPSAQVERLQESVDAIVEIDEDVQWFTYSINTSTAGTDYKLSSVVAEHVPIGIKDLS